jgi:predicted PolB exonuclease-like 3'-5' exonuclease
MTKPYALIAVDEIYKLNLKTGAYLDSDSDKINYYSYWEEVKKEIETYGGGEE